MPLRPPPRGRRGRPGLGERGEERVTVRDGGAGARGGRHRLLVVLLLGRLAFLILVVGVRGAIILALLVLVVLRIGVLPILACLVAVLCATVLLF